MDELVKNWKHIREEGLSKIDKVPISDTTRPKFIDETIIIDEGWVKGWTNDIKWLNYGLVYGGNIVPWADKCPQTLKLISKIPNVNMAGFSLLKPFGNIPVHTDTIDGVGGSPEVFHLGLSVPDPHKCILGVGNQQYNEEDGKLIQFDDRLEHWAVNDTLQDRLIFYIKLMNN